MPYLFPGYHLFTGQFSGVSVVPSSVVSVTAASVVPSSVVASSVVVEVEIGPSYHFHHLESFAVQAEHYVVRQQVNGEFQNVIIQTDRGFTGYVTDHNACKPEGASLS